MKIFFIALVCSLCLAVADNATTTREVQTALMTLKVSPDLDGAAIGLSDVLGWNYFAVNEGGMTFRLNPEENKKRQFLPGNCDACNIRAGYYADKEYELEETLALPGNELIADYVLRNRLDEYLYCNPTAVFALNLGIEANVSYGFNREPLRTYAMKTDVEEDIVVLSPQDIGKAYYFTVASPKTRRGVRIKLPDIRFSGIRLVLKPMKGVVVVMISEKQTLIGRRSILRTYHVLPLMNVAGLPKSRPLKDAKGKAVPARGRR